MKLGTFSLSLPVKDMDKSIGFYESLGFEIIDGGHMHEGFADTDTTKWRILGHSSVKIGLFQGMFDHHILTFNPTDVRSIQKELKSKGVPLTKEADESSEGPEHIVLTDPDGNRIMFDQH